MAVINIQTISPSITQQLKPFMLLVIQAVFLIICLPGARLVDYLIKRNQGKTARGAQHIEVA